MTTNRPGTKGAARRPPARRPAAIRARRRRRLQLLVAAILAIAGVAVYVIATSGDSGSSPTDVASATITGPVGPAEIPLEVGTPLAAHPRAGRDHPHRVADRATYTLGQFFAIWGQPVSTTQVGPAKGAVTTFVNGVRFDGDPAGIELGAHEDIQIDVGSPASPPERVDWSGTRL